MDEFAMGSSNENSAYNGTRNPWNSDHVPGGTSQVVLQHQLQQEKYYSH